MAKKDDDSKIVVIDENDYGRIYYLRNDPAQREYILVGYSLRPGSKVLVLSYMGEETEAYDCECSEQRDALKYMEHKYSPGADDDDE